MMAIYWTALSTTALAQLVFMTFVLVTFLQTGLPRIFKHRHPARSWFGAYLCFYFYAFLVFVAALLSPRVSQYVDPFVSLAAAGSLHYILDFTYRFNGLRPMSRTEHLLARLATGGFFLLEAGYAVLRVLALGDGAILFRPGYFDFGFAIGTLWICGVTIRKLLWFHHRAQSVGLLAPMFKRRFSAMLTHLTLIFLGFVLGALTLAHAYGLVSHTLREAARLLLNIGIILGFAMVHLNALSHKSSFHTKFGTSALSGVLAVLGVAVWVISASLPAPARHAAEALEGQAIRFHPEPGGGYAITALQTGYALPPNSRPVTLFEAHDLPFEFPFFGANYTQIYPRADGMIGLEAYPYWSETAFRYGWQPAIFPLALALLLPGETDGPDDPDAQFVISDQPDRVTLTWHRLSSWRSPQEQYSFQTVLHASGDIDFIYGTLPRNIGQGARNDNRVPHLRGLVPGFDALSGTGRARHPGNGPPLRITLAAGSPAATAGRGLIQDYSLDTLETQNRVYAPIAATIVLAALVTWAMFFVLARNALARPLDSLLEGVRRFGKGELAHRVSHPTADEIGTLARAFNQMAAEQSALLQGLEDKVQQRTEKVVALLDQNARLEERSRISADLHDAVSQTLFSSTMIAEGLTRHHSPPERVLEKLEDVVRLNRTALKELRAMLVKLRATQPEQMNLREALETLVQDLQRNALCTLTLEISGDAPLPAEVSHVFFRIAQESLHNVNKHARARTATLSFESLGSQAILTVEDDGIGFGPSDISVQSFGLAIMRQRAEGIGALLEFHSVPGEGTQITLIWQNTDDPS